MSFVTLIRNEQHSDLYSFVNFIEMQMTVLDWIESEFIDSVVIGMLIR